ncbi:hypothetical protein EUGRSUZ_D00063 [Eucalyptus grandis]|uniref:ADP-ribosyl cyclase/cyclic ADP-ribose hydrolase n=2 Tax=Eucalyptus grandis TaxID=71139 RepID=A0A059CBR9_EUCGR|nr:hypothetical protein EUGRSUZ_D00063 [Eucalyptus grandis]
MKRKASYRLATVPPPVPLSVYACKALQGKRCAVAWNYDVFLNIRGPDTRTGFVDFLYNSLVAARVHVFRDNDVLPVGEEIGPELLWAIRSCRIAIPIISEQYAQSKWCLRELNEIMDCHVELGISVFPVFYKVDVVDVRRRSGKFGEALSKQEKQGRREEVLRWKYALSFVASIREWISQAIANGHEG